MAVSPRERVWRKRVSIAILIAGAVCILSLWLVFLWRGRTTEYSGTAATWRDVPFVTPLEISAVTSQRVPYALIVGDGWYEFCASGRFVLPPADLTMPQADMLANVVGSGRLNGVALVKVDETVGGGVLGDESGLITSYVDDPRIERDFRKGISVVWTRVDGRTKLYLRPTDGAFRISVSGHRMAK